jgi:hypothetical protein
MDLLTTREKGADWNCVAAKKLKRRKKRIQGMLTAKYSKYTKKRGRCGKGRRLGISGLVMDGMDGMGSGFGIRL